MKRLAFFFRIGEFSLINDVVWTGLRDEFPELEWRGVDVERDIVGRDAILQTRATAGAMLRYGSRIVSQRQPPRDYFPRLPVVIEAVRAWVRGNVDPDQTALIFQTQSLFDARHPRVPHFLYTDHTYLANRRYAEPRPLLPVAKAWAKMERDLYAGADCNFVMSGFAARSLIEDYSVPAQRVECVYSGCNVPADVPAGSARSGRVILFVGVDWERKGGPELIEAFRRIRNGRPDVELWIVGCSPPIDEPGVKILGRLKPDQVAVCYRDADIFCLPSRIDPSAAVLAEAALAGLPVVATAVGGNVERVMDGETGYLTDPSGLAACLEGLLKDPAKRARMGVAGRKIAIERFTWSAVCGKIAVRMRKELES